MFGAKETFVLKVEGMHCGHCKARVEQALQAVVGVKKAQVNLEEKTATVIAKAGKTSADALKTAVIELGFEVVE